MAKFATEGARTTRRARSSLRAHARGRAWDPVELRSVLDAFLRRTDVATLVENDPVELVRGYDDPDDREVAGLIVAGLAYGRASVVREKAGAVLRRLGRSPARAIGSPQRRARLDGFVYRFQKGDDLPRFAAAIHRVRRAHGSLRAAFAAGVARDAPDYGDAMAAFAGALRAAWGPVASYGLGYLAPTTADGGAAKRLALYLRWMIRPADGMDPGTWAGPDLPPARLLAPLDTHLARIARYIGLTDRRTPDLIMAREISAALRCLDPEDPLKYEMALCHLGISGACPARRDPVACAACGIRTVCRL
jgi:uncharacterized protein (TIGR02757 family)